MEKNEKYRETLKSIEAMLKGEDDAIAIMATIACELKNAFETFSWVGFYRMVKPGLLKVGPYQGTHGCIEIPTTKGVCGKCATEKSTQVVQDVAMLPYHIACSSETRSEIVVPVLDNNGDLIAVLDIDSNIESNFDGVDKQYLETLCSLFQHK
jgi:L-methionine (R)-S-oxide reductase